MITLKAYAKINLFLDISARRKDCFHDIISYMQTVSLYDDIQLARDDRITVTGNDGVPVKFDLAYRAAIEFFHFSGIKGGVKIIIKKRIPIQGGLAGGSSDAAAVLRGLNKLYNTGYSSETLEKIGQAFGSDISFCINGGSRLVYGKGEILRPAPVMPECGIVIAAGNVGAVTASQFAELDRIFNNFSDYKPNENKLNSLISAASDGNICGMGENLFNIFEQTNGFDRSLLHIMKGTGSVGTLLCGSGSSVFGLYKTRSEADEAADKLKKAGIRVYTCEPVKNTED